MQYYYWNPRSFVRFKETMICTFLWLKPHSRGILGSLNFSFSLLNNEGFPEVFNSETFWTKVMSLVSGVKHRKIDAQIIKVPNIAGGSPFKL